MTLGKKQTNKQKKTKQKKKKKQKQKQKQKQKTPALVSGQFAWSINLVPQAAKLTSNFESPSLSTRLPSIQKSYQARFLDAW